MIKHQGTDLTFHGSNCRDFTGRVAIAELVHILAELCHFLWLQVVLGPVRGQGVLPLAQKFLPVLDGRKHGTGTGLVARGTAASTAHFEVPALAGGGKDGFAKARTQINASEQLGDLVENDRRSAARKGNESTRHANASGLLIKVVHAGHVLDAAVLAQAAKGGHGVVVLEAVLVDPHVGALPDFVIDARSTADAGGRGKVFKLGLRHEGAVLDGLQVLARAVQVAVLVSLLLGQGNDVALDGLFGGFGRRHGDKEGLLRVQEESEQEGQKRRKVMAFQFVMTDSFMGIKTPCRYS